MRLDEYIEELEPDERAIRRRLAKEKSYEITDHLERFERRFDRSLSGDSLVGSTAPSIFVGRSSYPDVPVGLLSPVGDERRSTEYVTSSEWYTSDFGIDDVLERRTNLLNANKQTNVHSPSTDWSSLPRVADQWDGFLGVQREIAIARDPVGVEVDLHRKPDLDIDTGIDISTPRGPRAPAKSATLTENPSVPRALSKAVDDTDWQATGAMVYLYRRGFDVYDINTILSAGTLGKTDERRLVPTRWSITAVDDTIGQYLRGKIKTNTSVDETQVWVNEYVGNRYWIVLTPGAWEFELVEMKAPGSVWNPSPTGSIWVGSASEGYSGRTGYVDETAGAYYASRLGVLEHLDSIGRQAKCLVIREVSDEYWAPVGVWQIRESVRNAFDGDHAVSETFRSAISRIVAELPISLDRLQRKSELVAGLQSSLTDFSDHG